jgi:HSP20 family protein
MLQREPKQSFLERLTGTVRSDEEIYNELPSRPDEEREEFQPDEEEGDSDAGQLAVDVYVTDGEIVIQSMIAGVTPEHLNINITRSMVSIRGKRIEPEGIGEEQYVAKELYWGEFERTVELPFEVDTDNAEAVEKYGLLIIRLPRLHTNRSQRLEVKSI